MIPPRIFHLGRTMSHLRRYRHIAAVLFKYGFTEFAQGLSRRFRLRVARRRDRAAPDLRRPERLRMAIEELGPTFVKFGQLLSTRPDLLPPEYVTELEKLQDSVAPVPFEKIRREIEHQLGRPLGQAFATFDPSPLASASIAQVYRATLPDGQVVAVKARRPGIVETLRTECEILQTLATVVKAALPKEETLDPVQMVREFTRAVLSEADLANERGNLERFRRNFEGDPTVHIPRTFKDWCGPGVLTMEFIDGVKVSDPKAVLAAGLDGPLIARRGADFVLRQVFDFGFIHTDPHPGNLFVLPGNVLAPLDFGQVARLGSTNRNLLGELVLAIVDQDAGRMIRAIRRADMVTYATDIRDLTDQMEELLETYAGVPLKEMRVGPMLLEAFELIRHHRVRPPAEFTMMLKSLMTVEALGWRLDGNFQLLDHLKPYARRLTLEQLDPRRVLRNTRRMMQETMELVANLPEEIGDILAKFRAGQFQMHVQHEHLESLIHTLDKASNRVSFALIIAGLVIASSLLVAQVEGTVFGLIRLQTLGTLGYIAAAVLGLWLLVSIIRSRHL